MERSQETTGSQIAMFHIYIENRALADIQEAIDYYDSQQVGVGAKFLKAVEKEFVALEKNPFYAIRYKNVRCKQIKKFPYLIHFTIDETEEIIFVTAVISTHRNPDTSWL